MANLIHKLFKNKSTQRLFPSLKPPQHHHLPKLTPSLVPQPASLDPKCPKDANFTLPLKFFPDSPFGYLLNPISSTGFDPSMAMEIEEGKTESEDEAGKVWADSVKKKRKKKMNKHKYKKLRKRLRRKT
ncbi:hypothetical protein V6N13_117048 [Hibiscus sabdariffa]|uniref:Small ribosomal subunit protein mS38 n=1 Tax=Hibiscus sabdariffa TaxID=183260 RepID=A0ABR2QHL5_9ROSI